RGHELRVGWIDRHTVADQLLCKHRVGNPLEWPDLAGQRRAQSQLRHGYHQVSSCTPKAAPCTASGLVAAATLPRNESVQCAHVANARREGRLRNLNDGVICGATVTLNTEPP